MIFTLTRGAARVLFNLAVVCFALGALLLYGAYRLVRAGVAGRKPQPVREAGFGTLLAVVGLVQAVKAAAPTMPEPDVDPELLRAALYDADRVSAGTYHEGGSDGDSDAA